MIADPYPFEQCLNNRATLGQHGVLQYPAKVGKIPLDASHINAERQGSGLACRRQLGFELADGQGLQRLLANLLDNSLRYTPAGGTVTVRATTENSRTGGPQLAIQVCDSGVGIAPEHLPHIFERFYRAAPSGREHLGLGLSIVDEIVAAHGGVIAVDSHVGVGTVVTVRLPLSNL